MWIALAVCGVLALLLLWPVTLRFRYDDRPRLWAWVLFVRINIPLGGTDKPAKPVKQKKKGKPKPDRKESSADKADDGKKNPFAAMVEREGFVGAVGEIAGILRQLLQKVMRLVSHIRIPRLRLALTVGGPDAAQAAIRHGQVCTAVYPLLGLCSALMQMRPPQISVEPDFTADRWAVEADVTLRLAPLWVITAGISALWSLIRFYWQNVRSSSAAKPRGASSPTKTPSRKGGVSQ